jgi:CubicO group peptidase (beta-lactamase class C family)
MTFSLFRSLPSAAAWLSAALLSMACAGSAPGDAAAQGGGAAAAANGGSGTATAGHASRAQAGASAGRAAGGTSAAGTSSASPAGSGTAAPAASAGTGNSDAGSRAGGMTSTADAAGTGVPPSTRVTECAGKALPPRALGQDGPFMVGPAAGGLPDYWPTSDWKMETPDKLGFDPDKLSAAVDFKTQYSSTQAVLVIRHGYIAAEKYTNYSATMTHESASMAKSFTSGLIGIAIGEGKLKSTDEKICQYFPMQWDCTDASDKRSKITITHSMNLETGLMWHEDWRSSATGTNDAYSPNMLDTVLARQATDEPGTNKRYSTGDPSLLTGAIQSATGMTAFAYGKQKVFDVLNLTSLNWNADTEGRTTTYAGVQATARDYAKYGYLYLQRGAWEGKQIIPAEWVDKTTIGSNPCEDWYQWLWHINLPVRLGPQDPACPTMWCQPTEIVDLPPDGYFAAGVNGQFIFVIPSSDLVIVRLANDPAGIEHWDEYARGFVSAVLAAIP